MLNQPAPDFTFADLDGRPHTLSAYRGRIVGLNFWSAECPWSARTDALWTPRLPDWERHGIVMLPIAANASETDADIRAEAAERGVAVPILRDPGQDVADLYGAVTTPHIFIIDRDGVLRYRGAFDDANFRRREPTRIYVVEAFAALLDGRAPDPAETLAYGCAIVRKDTGG